MRAEPSTLFEKAGKIEEVHSCYLGENYKRQVLLKVRSDVLQYSIQASSWHSTAIAAECRSRRRISLRKIDGECRRH